MKVCVEEKESGMSVGEYSAELTDFNYNLFDQTGQADWGYNGIRYAKAKVNNVNGVILLPDNWSSTTYSLSNTNQGTASFSSNTISSSQWSTLENAGAVFLPAAGYRNGTSVSNASSSGYYWSASYDRASAALYVGFNDGGLYADYLSSRHNGRSVRLVRSSQ